MRKNLLAFCSIVFLLASCQEKLSYEGYVRDAKTGEPLEGVLVEIGIPKTRTLIKTETNAEGYYKISFPLADTILLGCRTPRYKGFGQFIMIDKEKFKQNNNKLNFPDIALEFDSSGGAYCIGKVVDENGKPIKGVDVCLIPENGGLAVSAVTSKNGTYTIKNIVGRRLIKYTFVYNEKFTKDTVKIMLDSLGTTVYAPDVILKKK